MARLDRNAIERPSPLAVFVARAEARALLWAAGELDLHDAVDELQAAAVRAGLVAELGQDRVQDIMVEAFTEIPADDAWSAPGWREAAAEYHQERNGRTLVVEIEPERLTRLRELMADDVTFERAWHEINHPTDRAAARTVEALMLGLREHGVAALAEPKTRRRLADLSSEQIRQILARLIAL